MNLHRISCPKCGHKFALDKALNHDIEQQVRADLEEVYEKKQAQVRATLQREAEAAAACRGAELEAKVHAQNKELTEARAQERALLKSKAELEERAAKADLEAERKLAAERERIRKAAQEQAREEHRLKDVENAKQLEDMRRQIEELKRKAEQGSQQLQGAAQEIELEAALRHQFPRDEITAVKTGERGADVLQRVISDTGQFCGTILWESKRVKKWQDPWIGKVIQDKQAAKADIAVIVTEALPANLKHFGSVRGVLVTTLPLAICLAETLRVNLGLLGQARLAADGHNEIKDKVFQYLLGPEFHDAMSTIAEQFLQMQSDLNKEKASIVRTWSRREKQLAMVVTSTAKFYGGLEGLYGNALPTLPVFELGQHSSSSAELPSQ